VVDKEAARGGFAPAAVFEGLAKIRTLRWLDGSILMQEPEREPASFWFRRLDAAKKIGSANARMMRGLRADGYSE